MGGNLTKAEAKEVWRKVKGELAAKPFPKRLHPKKRMLVLPEVGGPYIVDKKTKMEGNFAIITLQAGAFSFEKEAVMNILGSLWRSDYRTSLRTKQQVAYIIGGNPVERADQLINPVERADQLMYLFFIGSSTHTPEELRILTEAFIAAYAKDSRALISKERFEKIRKEWMALLKKNPSNLRAMCTELTKLTFRYQGDYERRQKQIKALEELTYEIFISNVTTLCARTNYRRIAFLITGVAPPGKDFVYKKIAKKKLQQKGTWVSEPN